MEKSYFLQHRGIIEFFILESGYANGFVIEQEEKENPLSLPVRNQIFDPSSISISVCLSMHFVLYKINNFRILLPK